MSWACRNKSEGGAVAVAVVEEALSLLFEVKGLFSVDFVKLEVFQSDDSSTSDADVPFVPALENRAFVVS